MGTAQGPCSLSFRCLTDDLGFRDSKDSKAEMLWKREKADKRGYSSFLMAV